MFPTANEEPMVMVRLCDIEIIIALSSSFAVFYSLQQRLWNVSARFC